MADSTPTSTKSTCSTTISSSSSMKTARLARFAEATTVHSPIDPPQHAHSPFADPAPPPPPQKHAPSDVGFGYISSAAPADDSSIRTQTLTIPHSSGGGPKSPLKSALKSPGAAPTPRRTDAILSPTFKEESLLEKQEVDTEKVQAQDLKVKTRVRMAKMFLRGVNFSCSLIVLAMISTTFQVFNATRHLPPRNNLPAWSQNGKIWPQVLLLSIACVSLFAAVLVFIAYCRGGHHRAEKIGVYYSTFAVVFFVFSIIMWAIGAGVLNEVKAHSNGQDIWGWSCKDNKRKKLFDHDVGYELICRLQGWSLICCIIEVVVETLTIGVYAIIFYRYYSKRKLRKSMSVRDRARSDLYLAQLRSQSAPNTPGLAPYSPRDGGWRPPTGHPYRRDEKYLSDPAADIDADLDADPYSNAEKGALDTAATIQYPKGVVKPKPFTLQQPPPPRAATVTPQSRSQPAPPPPPMSPRSSSVRQEQVSRHHAPAAPGEQQYAAVPVPGAYASPLASPGLPSTTRSQPLAAAPAHPAFGGFDFGDAVTSRR